ncbi:MAG: mechanosensitive ion channel family protein [Chloroflexota bacterium]
MMSWLQSTLLDPVVQAKLLNTLLILVALWLVRWLAVRVVTGRVKDVHLRYRWVKTINYLMGALGFFLVGRLWWTGIQAAATFLGLFSAGVAIALREPISNLAGWFYILWARPFAVGDRVQIGKEAGDVIDLHFFTFTLLEIGNWVEADQSTGRVLQIPNSKVFVEPVANYTAGFEYIWHEMTVIVTLPSNWEKAKTILQAIGDQHAGHLARSAEAQLHQSAHRYFITYSRLTPIVYTRLAGNGVSLTLRFLCEPRQRRLREEAIWEDLLRAFAAEPDIVLQT